MFDIEIELTNSAFAGHPGNELARILRDLANRLESLTPDGEGVLNRDCPLRDVNGNRCGNWRISYEESGE